MATNFRDDAGVVRLDGTLYAPGATVGDVFTVQADGSLAPAAGGGSQPVQASYNGNAVSIANGDGALLTWDTLAYGVDLLDRSTPGVPLMLTAGLYLFVVTVGISDLTPGGNFSIGMGPGDASYGGNAATTFATPGVQMVCPSTFLTDGGAVVVSATNNDGVASRDFTLSAAIVKLA